jgi:hypothetical protein
MTSRLGRGAGGSKATEKVLKESRIRYARKAFPKMLLRIKRALGYKINIFVLSIERYSPGTNH